MGSHSGSCLSLPSDSSSGATSHASDPREGSQSQREIQGEVQDQGKTMTIDTLTDDILLDIFDACKIVDPSYQGLNRTWKWDRLAHVSQRWRQLIFGSPLRLRLQLLCTPGTPVRKHLSCWPDFPIVVDYGYKKLARKEEDNIIAALEHPNRVRVLILDVTTRQLAKLASVVHVSYPALEYLCLGLHRNAPVLASGFFGGSAPSLRELSLDAVPFPALPTLLLSACNLDTLELTGIPPAGYISPEAMAMCLAASTSLERLDLGFQSTEPHPDGMRLPPVTRAVLPALITFDFEGVSDYLEDLVARIDCPKLKWINIGYLHRPVGFRVAQLSEFIDRLEDPRLRQFRWVDVGFDTSGGIRLKVAHSKHDITICLEFYGGTEWSVSHIVQVFRQFSTKLSFVRHLCIAYYRRGPEIDQHEWVQLLRPFTTVQTLHLKRDWPGRDPPALENVDGEMMVTEAEILPALGLICFDCQCSQVASLAFKFFENLVAARRLSECPVTTVTDNREYDKRVRPYVRNRDYQIHSSYEHANIYM